MGGCVICFRNVLTNVAFTHFRSLTMVLNSFGGGAGKSGPIYSNILHMLLGVANTKRLGFSRFKSVL